MDRMFNDTGEAAVGLGIGLRKASLPTPSESSRELADAGDRLHPLNKAERFLGGGDPPLRRQPFDLTGGGHAGVEDAHAGGLSVQHAVIGTWEGLDNLRPPVKARL
jgi:hypothetical protein